MDGAPMRPSSMAGVSKLIYFSGRLIQCGSWYRDRTPDQYLIYIDARQDLLTLDSFSVLSLPRLSSHGWCAISVINIL
jgi:hypothetical protein